MKTDLNYKIVKIIAHIAAWLPLAWLVYAAVNLKLGGDPQEEVLHELGIWGLIFLLLSLTMTPARKLIPRFPWIKFRRMLGLYAFFYLLLHLTMFFIFYLQLRLGELWSEILERPYITVGMLAIIGMVPLAITSTKGFQKRLGRRWKKLHTLVYPIAGLGLLHFIWQSKSDLNEPLLYVLWAAIIMGIRISWNKKKQKASSYSSKKSLQTSSES